MHILGQRTLGVLILILLGALVLVKQWATGSLVEFDSIARPWAWLTNLFNLFFLLIVNPAVAILLVFKRLDAADPSMLAISSPALLAGLEIAGLTLYLMGFSVMIWALLCIGGNYQLGGSAPRKSDEFVCAGPYQYIRHPMYSAALSIALGLALLAQSLAVFIVFCAFVALIIRLIPIEEGELAQAYRERYDAYRAKAKRLIPFVY